MDTFEAKPLTVDVRLIDKEGESHAPINLEAELEKFDRQRWSVACREMQIRIIHGNIDAAHAVIDAFCRFGNYVQATMASALSAVFPVRLANTLEQAGYLTVAAVDRATDSELRVIGNVGDVNISTAREIIKKIKEGRVLEHNEEDADLLDETCFISRWNCTEGSGGVTVDNTTRVLEALKLIADSPDTAVEVIDAQIAEMESKLGELRRLKKLVGKGPSEKVRSLTKSQEAFETKIVEFVKKHGKTSPSDLSVALKTSYAVIGQTVARSSRLVKDGKLVALA